MKNVLYTDLHNSFKFSKLLDHFSLGTVKYSLGLGKVGTMKSHVEQYNRDADIQICSGCYQFSCKPKQLIHPSIQYRSKGLQHLHARKMRVVYV